MRPRLCLQVLSGTVLLLLLATGAGVLATLEIERLLAGEMRRTADELRESLMQAAIRLPEDDIFAGDVRRMMRTTRLRGLEIFSPQGRRVWSAGEPLEIVGFPLDQRRSVTHTTADGSRFESYWHADFLQARHGLALRLDRDWQQPVRRRMLIASLIAAAVLLAAAAGIGLWIGKTVHGGRVRGKTPTRQIDAPYLQGREDS